MDQKSGRLQPNLISILLKNLKINTCALSQDTYGISSALSCLVILKLNPFAKLSIGKQPVDIKHLHPNVEAIVLLNISDSTRQLHRRHQLGSFELASGLIPGVNFFIFKYFMGSWFLIFFCVIFRLIISSPIIISFPHFPTSKFHANFPDYN